MRTLFSPAGLRIALIAPPWYPLPPNGYGGTELVVHLLHSELRRMGHRVTVFGAEGSDPDVEALAPASWSDDLGGPIQHVREATYLARVSERLQGEHFDVIHDHLGPAGVLLAILSKVATVVVHTMHGQLREPDLSFYREVDRYVNLVAISAAQAATAPDLRVAAVVHNAVDMDATKLSLSEDGYLIEIARVCPEKGQHLAIEVARRTGRKLILAGKLERSAVGERYFREKIVPHLGAQVEYHSNVAGALKAELIARAAAGIYPLQWAEPFGLALVECMVSGAPVLALPCGSSPELIEPGVTGFIAKDMDELVAAVDRLDEIDRARCASVARARFAPRRMAEAYLEVYGQGLALAEPVAGGEAWPAVPSAAAVARAQGAYTTLSETESAEPLPAQ